MSKIREDEMNDTECDTRDRDARAGCCRYKLGEERARYDVEPEDVCVVQPEDANPANTSFLEVSHVEGLRLLDYFTVRVVGVRVGRGVWDAESWRG